MTAPPRPWALGLQDQGECGTTDVYISFLSPRKLVNRDKACLSGSSRNKPNHPCDRWCPRYVEKERGVLRYVGRGHLPLFISRPCGARRFLSRLSCHPPSCCRAFRSEPLLSAT